MNWSSRWQSVWIRRVWILAFVVSLFVAFAVFCLLPPHMRPMVFCVSAARDVPLACLGSHQGQLVFLDLEKRESWLAHSPGDGGIITDTAFSPAGHLVAISHLRNQVIEVNGRQLGAVKVDRPRLFVEGPRPPGNIRLAGEKGETFLMRSDRKWQMVHLDPNAQEASKPVFIDWLFGWSDGRKPPAIPSDALHGFFATSEMDYDESAMLGVVGLSDGRVMELNWQTEEWREIHRFDVEIYSAKWLGSRRAVVGIGTREMAVVDRDGNEICRKTTPATLLAVSRGKPWIISGEVFGSKVTVWRFENDALLLDREYDIETLGIKPWSTWSQLFRAGPHR